jgi:predicted RNA binding protein YcfA (HicA-like mRNA interferase family)
MKEREAVRALKNLGFSPDDPSGTSHRHWRLIRDGKLFKVTLDAHNGEVKANDIRSMIKQAGVSKKKWYQAAANLEVEAEPEALPAPKNAAETEE